MCDGHRARALRKREGDSYGSDEEVIQIVQSYPAERRYALAAMQDMQHAFNYIPRRGFIAWLST